MVTERFLPADEGVAPDRSGALTAFVAAAAAYMLAAVVSYFFVIRPSGVVIIWLPSGLMLSILLLAPRRLWPYLVAGGALGNVAADLLNGQALMIAAEGAAANTLEVFVAAWAVRRLTSGPVHLRGLRQVAVFVLVGTVISNGLTAFAGSFVLMHGSSSPIWKAWLTWWTGDGAGMLLAAPLLLTWSAAPAPRRLDGWPLVEGIAGFSALIVMGQIVLSTGLDAARPLSPEPYIMFPFLFWAAIRLGPRGAATATFLLSALTVWNASNGLGPFVSAGQSATNQTLRVYAYLALAAVTSLVSAAILDERRRAESDLRDQARHAQFLAEVAVSLTDASRVPEMLQYCADAAVRHLGVALCRIWTMSATAPVLEVQASSGIATHPDGDNASVPLGRSRVGRVALERRPLVINHVPGDSSIPNPLWVWKENLAAFAGYPLVVEDKVVGVFTVYAREPLSDRTLDVIASVTRTLALGIDRVRLDALRGRLANILEAASDFVMISQPEGPPLYINRSARAALGIDADEAVETLFAFRPPEYESLFRTVIVPALQRDGVWSGQTEYVARSGRHITVSQVSVAHVDARGEIEFLSTISRDISDLRRTEQDLRVANERTRFALEAARAGVWEAEPLGGGVTWSETMALVHGLARESFRGTTDHFLALIHPDDRAEVQQLMRAHATRTGTFEFSARTLWPDGSTHWMESRGRVLDTGVGQPPRILGVAQDVTERKQAEEALKRLASILEATPDFVTIGRVVGPPLYINPAARKALGIGADEQVESLLTFRPPGFSDFLLSTILPGAAKHGSWIGETEYISRSGRAIPVSQVTLLHRDPNGEVEFISTTSMDITEQRQLESQLRQSQKMEAVGQLAGGVAHDFNNILTVILNYAERLAESPDAAADDRDAAAEIRNAALRGASLTRRLLAFGRRQALQPQVTKLSSVARQLMPMLGRLLGDHIVISLRASDTDPDVWADVSQLEQVILNLVINAGDAMPNGGPLSITVAAADLDTAYAETHPGTEPGPYAVLDVADTGEGMSAETIARIFEPFFTTKPIGRGTGLGLSTVFGIVSQMRGHIEVASQLGAGTTFRVWIPKHTAAAENVETAQQPSRSTGSLQGTERVLVVEDEVGVRALITAILQRHGYAVTTASSAAQGLAAFATADPPDLVISDIQMPGGSGIELVSTLRAIVPEIRVILMSGYSDDMAAAEAHPFLAKPFRGVELAELVRRVLDDPA